MGLSIIPNLWRYDLSFPCPVTNIVTSGKTGIFSRSLFLTDGKKALVTVPAPSCETYLTSVWAVGAKHRQRS